jgi:hypothetical protein
MKHTTMTLMVSIVIFNIGDHSIHRNSGHFDTHGTHGNHEHSAKFGNQIRLKCALDSCNLSDILFRFRKKGMCGQMSAEISNVKVHEHPSSGDKLLRTGEGKWRC